MCVLAEMERISIMRIKERNFNESSGKTMKQTERRIYLIKELIAEQTQYRNTEIPRGKNEQEQLLRSLMNVRPPQTIGKAFLTVQDAYLQARATEKGIVQLSELSPVNDNMYLWQGDITRLAADAIVNAANSKMTGCYCPCHNCIDNCIHTFAGVQLRLECAELMRQQGHDEPTGGAKITNAYNLPCKYVIHTVGPIIAGSLTHENETLLAECYRSCLALAELHGIKSIAFCCISTGEFHFPNKKAAEIAARTVSSCLKESKSEIKVIFNVFKDTDYEIYKELLGTNQ